ncbi:MAG: CBS domain-containing protein [Gammaproteobacteria bacterium]|nr:CBS domain-containing protein [Gammaproteobacteria bacterium]
MRLVRDIMTAAVRTLHRDTIISEVESEFRANGISGAPLVDESGCLVGFISKSDISRFDSTGDDPFYARAHEIANPKVITTKPSDSIEQAAQLMLREYVHHLVVMDRAAIVGVLSAFDFVKLAASASGDDNK